MNDTVGAILKDTFTILLIKHRLRILKSYLNQTFFGGSAQKDEVLTVDDENWLKSLPDTFYQKFTKDNIYKQFDSLDGEILKLMPLIIYLPFEASSEVVGQIGNFVRQTFQGVKLLDIKFDPNLIAGCALSWKGVFKDYSLRAKIEERKGEILEGFKKFLR